MTKKISYIFIFSFFILSSFFTYCINHSIVFIHLGKSIPNYISHAIQQARLFNPDCPIYLVTDNQSLLSGKITLKAEIISANNLVVSEHHKNFRQRSTLDRNSREGFWLHTSERFLVLYDFIKQFNLTNVFHMENDTMLYADLEKLMPIFVKNYSHIGAVFDNDDRCIPCFIYIRNKHAAEKIANCFAKHAAKGKNDMYLFGLLKKESAQVVSNLPIIMPDYIDQVGLKSTSGHKTKKSHEYINNFDIFNSIFDGAALGQFLGGIDPRNGPSKPGFINETCLFNPSFLTFSWKQDELERSIPYAMFLDKTYKINTLHIHSKNLKKFLS